MDAARADGSPNGESGTPTFSVVIPTLGRAGQLRHCLTSLSTQTYPASRFEVIVIDDGSASPPGDVVSDFIDVLRVRLHCQANAGPGLARNSGAALAGGDYLAFVDDDCEATPGWLSAMAACLVEHPDHALGGSTANGLTSNGYAEASQGLVGFLYTYYNTDPADALFFATNNLVVPAGAFRDMGGFAARFSFSAEDRDFCVRWRRTGRHLRYVPEARVIHFHHMGLGGYWRQHVLCGRGAFRYHLAYRDPLHRPFSPDGAGFGVRLMASALTTGPVKRRAVSLCLFSLAQVATLVGYVRQANAERAEAV